MLLNSVLLELGFVGTTYDARPCLTGNLIEFRENSSTRSVYSLFSQHVSFVNWVPAVKHSSSIILCHYLGEPCKITPEQIAQC